MLGRKGGFQQSGGSLVLCYDASSRGARRPVFGGRSLAFRGQGPKFRKPVLSQFHERAFGLRM